jgi:hypothetical protein
MRWRVLALVSAVLILTLSVAPKVRYYATFDAHRYAAGEPRVIAFFEARKWTLSRIQNLDESGAPRALHYSGPECAEGVDVVAISPNGQDNASVEALVTPGTRLFYLDQGRAFQSPPRLGIVHRWMGEFAESLGLSVFRPYPVVAVIEPENCALESKLPWSDL